MKIIVPIKQILDPSGVTVRRDKERIFINKEAYILEAGSKAAIEAALQVRDVDGGEHEIVAVSLGEPRADDALREALAMGCDEAYLLTDEAFQDADISVTTAVLAAAIEKLGGADLVIAGQASADTGSGQVGARLAEALGYACVTAVYELAQEAGGLQATRRWGTGYARVQVSLPAVVTVAPEAFPPRYAHGARIMDAYRKWEVTIWDASDLELGTGALQPLLSFRRESFPAPLEVGEKFQGDPAEVARDVVTALRIQNLIA
ncbi:MAG: electron transfer flavoprotein subunit beta/FixA family protein [Anaerolineae bacterium]|nr:electron transfer flavoprotein subunit beta/FixA family protein [Anaerolineae bacterium]